MTTHVQCILQRRNETQVSWIPKKYANVGGVVKLKERDGWHDGWVVTSTGIELPTEQVMEMGHTASQAMKKRTDI